MSYAHLSEGDIYIWTDSLFPLWHCQVCSLEGHAHLYDLKQLKEHVQKHIDAGHKVPERTMERIDLEIAEYGLNAVKEDIFGVVDIEEEYFKE